MKERYLFSSFYPKSERGREGRREGRRRREEEEEEEGWEGRGGEMKNPAVLKTCNQHPLVSLRGNSGHRGAVVLCGIGRSVPARLSQLSNFQRLA